MKSNLNVSEAAKFLGVSKSTIRRWDEEEKLIANRTAGNQRRYPIEVLVAFKRLYR